MPQLYELLKGYVNSGTLYYEITHNNKLFYEKYNINLESNFIPTVYEQTNKQTNENIFSQNGGNVYSTTLKDIEYSFSFYKVNDYSDTDGTNFINGIIIKTKNSPNINEYYPSKHCALLLYDNKNLLKIAFLNMHAECYDVVGPIDESNKLNQIKNEEKSGSTLLKLIILWAKNEKFKRIILSDQARFTCKEKIYSMSYELKYMHTLTTGNTWYGKYGFKFINQVDIDALAYNKNFLDNFKTEDYPFDLLVKIIMNEIVDQRVYVYMDKYDYLFNINQIIKLYDEYKDKPFYKFMKIISRTCCFLVSHIYMKIFESLRLKKYIGSDMEFIIAT